MEFNPANIYFQTTTTKTFEELWKDRGLEDVTLVSMDDKQVTAHKIILSSFSTFFKKIFQRYRHQNLLIYLKDIQYKYLCSLLEFIYTGQCDIEEPDLEQFLSVGKGFGVNGLFEVIVKIDSNINIEN